MRSRRAHILACVWVVWAGASGALARAEGSDESQVVHLEPFHGPDVTALTHYGNCQWLYPLDEPNEVLVSEPVYGSDKRVYYAARYGDAEDNVHTFVIDESAGTGSGFDTLYVDLDNDNCLNPEKEKFALALSGLTTREARNVRVTLSVSTGGKTIPYSFNFKAFQYKDRNHPIKRIHANCRNSTIMVGEATFGGKRCKVALADLDSNGLFNNYEQDLFRGDRFFVDLDGDGSFSDGSGGAESFPYAQYAKIGAGWYTVEATLDGGTVRIRPAEPAFGTVRAAEHVQSVSLSAPRQFQRLKFKDGRAMALAGAYHVRDVTLEVVDRSGQRWSTRGRYRPAGPEIAIGANQETTLGDVLPRMIQVAVLTTSDPGTIELEPRILDAHGGTFSTLRKDNSRHQPPAHLVIKDAEGRQIAKAALEYG